MFDKKMFLHIIAWLVIFIIVMVFFWENFSFAGQNSDSPAYIFLASRISRGQPLIYEDEFASQLNKWGENNIINLISPKLYYFNEEKNLFVHKYPIGLPLLLSLGYFLCGHSEIGWYLAYIILSFAAIPLFFYLSLEIFKDKKYKTALAIIDCLVLFTQTTYFSYLIAPPSRDIIILTIGLGIIFTLFKQNKISIILPGFLLVLGYFTRETIILLLPVIILLILKDKENRKKRIIYWSSSLALFFLFFIFLHWWVDGEFISWQHLLMPQADHVSSLSLDNYTNAHGQTARGQSTILIYLKQLFINFFSAPYLSLLCTLSGLLILIKNKKWGFLVILLLWLLPGFFFFASWTNPYPRYVLFLMPAIIILILFSFNFILEKVNSKRFYFISVIGIIFFISLIQGKQIYNIIKQPNDFHKNHYETSLSYKNYQQIEALEKKLKEKNNPLLIIDNYYWYEMQDTFRSHLDMPVYMIDVMEFYDKKNYQTLLTELRKKYTIYFLSTDEELLFKFLGENKINYNSFACDINFSQHPLNSTCKIWIKKGGL